jgi:hypothetical protein
MQEVRTRPSHAVGAPAAMTLRYFADLEVRSSAA